MQLSICRFNLSIYLCNFSDAVIHLPFLSYVIFLMQLFLSLYLSIYLSIYLSKLTLFYSPKTSHEHPILLAITRFPQAINNKKQFFSSSEPSALKPVTIPPLTYFPKYD